MSRNPSKIVFAMAALLAVWVAVFWLYKPRLSEASGAANGGGISYGLPPDVARALAATDPVVNNERPVPVGPLPVAPLPGQSKVQPPPAPAPTPGKHLVPPRFTDYTVQKGDTSFSAISKRFYGTPAHGEAISRANPFVTPDKLIAGKTKLRIPKDPTNIQGRIEETPATPAGEPQAPATPSAAADEPQTHTVQPGETLGAISKRYYGTTGRWKAILEANADMLDKPEHLRAGMTLKIPPKD